MVRFREGGVADVYDSSRGAVGGGDNEDGADASTRAADIVDAELAQWTNPQQLQKKSHKRARPSEATDIADTSVNPVIARSCAAAIEAARAAAVAAAAAAGRTVGGQRQAGRDALRDINARALAWCTDNFLSLRSLRQAVSVRDQLAAMVAALGLPLASCGNAMEPLLRALATGCFLNAAVRLPPGAASASASHSSDGGTGGGGYGAANRVEYRTLARQAVCVHPSSALVLAYAHVRNRQAALAAAEQRRKAVTTGTSSSSSSSARAELSAALSGVAGYPDTVVYAEVVRTQGRAQGPGPGQRPYMRHVTRVEREWLAAMRPDLFGPGPAGIP